MQEARRREISRLARILKTRETQLDTARTDFAAELKAAVVKDGNSLGSVSKTLTEIGRPLSRQRVHQIIQEGG